MAIEVLLATEDGAALFPSYGSMTEASFSRLSQFIQSEYGIKLPPSKRYLVESRIRKRLVALGSRSYEDYFQYLFSRQGAAAELVNAIDVITTNKTDFFRENVHFDFLKDEVLPELSDSAIQHGGRHLSLWSAACSTGEEPYSLAMMVAEYAHSHPGFRFSILATDIATDVLQKAELGIYSEEKIEPIPAQLRKKYLLKGRNDQDGLYRIAAELRDKVEFARANLLDESFHPGRRMDIIFCRNVLIYFSKPTQEKALNRLCRLLRPGGYLFLGHSESIMGMGLPVVPVTSAVFRKL